MKAQGESEDLPTSEVEHSKMLQYKRASPEMSCGMHRNSESEGVVHVKSSIVWRWERTSGVEDILIYGCRVTDAVRVLGFSVVGMGTQSQGHVRV